MRKKHKVLHTLEVMSEIGPQGGVRKYVTLSGMLLCAVLMVGFAFAGILTDMHLFGWLLYGAMGLEIIVDITGILWLIRDALQKINENESHHQ